MMVDLRFTQRCSIKCSKLIDRMWKSFNESAEIVSISPKRRTVKRSPVQGQVCSVCGRFKGVCMRVKFFVCVCKIVCVWRVWVTVNAGDRSLSCDLLEGKDREREKEGQVEN